MARGKGFEPLAFGSGGPPRSCAGGSTEAQAAERPTSDSGARRPESARSSSVRHPSCPSHAPLALDEAVRRFLRAYAAHDDDELRQALKDALRAVGGGRA